MKHILEGLDDQQAAAADHHSGKAVVIAGAGSGKTRTLVRRTAMLIAKGIPPDSILLTSFTRASANEIMHRARQFEPRAVDITCGTFHSVGVRVVREYHDALKLPYNFTVMDQGDAEETVKRAAVVEAIDDIDMRASRLAKIISYSRNTGIPYERVMSMPKNVEHKSSTPQVIQVAKAYRALKQRMGILDYDDILAYWGYLCEHQTIGVDLRRRFRHLMIDEHQDSNHLQLKILHALGDRSAGSVMVVGDPSQSIYGFRGAAPETMFGFQARWPEAKVFLIERNYRSVGEIVSAADAVDQSMAQRFKRTLRSARGGSGERPVLVDGGDQSSCTRYLVDLVSDRWREEGIPLSEQAILVRSTTRARRIELELDAAGIPYRFVGGIRIHDAKHVKDLMAVVRVAVNPADRLSWYRLITLIPKIGAKTADKITDRMFDPSEGAIGVMSHVDDVLEALDKAAASEKRGKHLEGLSDLVREVWTRRGDAKGALLEIFERMQDVYEHEHGDEWEWRKRELLEFIELSAQYGSIDEFLQTVTVDVSADKSGMTGEESAYGRDVLTVSTIHGSKGLEWHSVYIPEFIDGHIPSMTAEGHDEKQDELRLFYVAVTRAKDSLTMVRPATIHTIKRGDVSAYPSPYEAIVERHVQRLRRDRSVDAGIGHTFDDEEMSVVQAPKVPVPSPFR